MDAFYEILGDRFSFVSTLPKSTEELKGGEDYSDRPYCLIATDSPESHRKALDLALYSDVCVFGANSQEYAIYRARYAKNKLSFEMGERWLKRGLVNCLSITFLKWYRAYLLYYRYANFYKLCNGAFVKRDDEIVSAYKDRHFKWGYFTSTSYSIQENTHLPHNSNSLMWCSRFIRWKHPELPILLARKLKDSGYDFCIDMFGTGPEYDRMVDLCMKLQVDDVVHLQGAVANSIIRQQLFLHNLFVFTSDRREGWGAVLNESMSSNCAVVASDDIGSAPFLIKDGENGLLFRTNDLNSLYEKVVYLLNNPLSRERIARNAASDIRFLWSPQKAAQNFLVLIDYLEKGKESPIFEGPCSKA